MGELALSNPCRRILLDAGLAGDTASLLALGAELREVLGERELILLHAGSLPAEIAAAACFHEVLSVVDEDAGLSLLAEQHEQGNLADTLLVSARERSTSWARNAGLAVLIPAQGDAIAPLLDQGELAVRDAATLILRAKRRRQERPLLIGVNGIHKSGKTRFSERLTAQLQRLGFATELLSLEIFTAPKKSRQAKGYAESERLLHKHYQMERLREQLILPMQSGRSTSLALDVYDPERERVVGKRNLSLDRNSMICLEGPFLFQEDLFSGFDFRIYLVTDFERALALELGDLSGKARKKREDEFVRCELAAQSLYLRQETPWKRAHLVLRGMNSATPRIESWHSEL